MKKITILSLVILLSLSFLAFADETAKNLKKKGLHVADLSEPNQINLKINKIQQAIQQQDAEEIKKMLSDDYIESDPSLKKEIIQERLESIFSDLSQTRGFLTRTSAQAGWKVTSTHDFFIRNIKINVQQDQATAECEVGFYSAGKDYKNIKETLSFIIKHHRWLLAGSRNLFGFLAQGSKTTKAEMGFPDLVDPVIMGGSKDDFTSTHMLVPVNLFVYDGTSIPRFNKTQSLQWFWQFYPPYGWYPVNVMNYPYGIVADVQVAPGPDFNYEFLFVTDVTCDKIVGAEMNEWAAQYGTEGSDEGQFQQPRGICSEGGPGGGGNYIVADMFNNRVVTYYLEKTYDHPIWRSTLTHDFNRPIDVDAKWIEHTSPPVDVEYIAVVDYHNHRLVFFHAWPYVLGFDRSYGGYGSGEGQFILPTSVCFGIDPETGWQTNDVYVTDYGNDRLVRFYIQEPEAVIWRGSYQFPTDVELTSVEVDNKGLVYVLDRRHGKVYKFAPSQDCPYDFSLLGVWGETGTADGQLLYPNVLAVAHGRYCPYPYPCVPLNMVDVLLGDVFVSESWGDQTGVRRFVIGADVVNLSASYVPYNEDTGEGNLIWYTYHLTDFAEDVTEQVCLGAEVCTTYDRGSLNWGPQGGDWNVGSHPHGETYTVKITASSIYDPTVVVQKTVDVYVDTITTHNPIISRGIRCNFLNDPNNWCDGCGQCIKTGHSYIVDVQAFDPDGDPILYEWSCGYGWLVYEDYFYKRIEIPENYICYQAPVSGKTAGESAEGFESLTSEWSKRSSAGLSDFIGVTVRDPYGGEAHTSELFTVYPESLGCSCGDVNVDGIVNSGDITRLIGYLYLGESPPPDPIERADVNNDCEVEPDDIIALINYVFLGGARPGCCWIH